MQQTIINQLGIGAKKVCVAFGRTKNSNECKKSSSPVSQVNWRLPNARHLKIICSLLFISVFFFRVVFFLFPNVFGKLFELMPKNETVFFFQFVFLRKRPQYNHLSDYNEKIRKEMKLTMNGSVSWVWSRYCWRFMRTDKTRTFTILLSFPIVCVRVVDAVSSAVSGSCP